MIQRLRYFAIAGQKRYILSVYRSFLRSEDYEEVYFTFIIVGVGFVTGDNPGPKGRKARIGLRSGHLSYVYQAASA